MLIQLPGSFYNFDRQSNDIQVAVNYVRCQGSENSLKECIHFRDRYSGCSHDDDVGVRCQPCKKVVTRDYIAIAIRIIILVIAGLKCSIIGFGIFLGFFWPCFTSLFKIFLCLLVNVAKPIFVKALVSSYYSQWEKTIHSM